MSEHSSLSPSSAHRWLICPASVSASAAYPNTDSAASLKGTGIHALAAEMVPGLLHWPTGTGDLKTLVQKYAGGVCPETQQVRTAEWVEIARDYGLYVRECYQTCTGEPIAECEVRLNTSTVLDQDDQSGTADYVIADIEGGELHVIDLKSGSGVQVRAEQNAQLMLYGLAALDDAEEMLGVSFDRLTLHIAQPPRDYYGVWSLVAHGAETGHWRAKFRDAARAALSDDPPFAPDEAACRWCPHKANCQALQDAVAEFVTDAVPPSKPDDFADIVEPDEGTADTRLAQLFAAAPLVEGWLRAVRNETQARLMDGKAVPGFKLVQARQGARAWTDADAADEVMSQSNRVKRAVRYKQTLISPTQAEKAFKAGDIGRRTWQELQPLITRPDGSITVAPEEDSRPAYDPTTSPEDFDNLTDEGAENE